MLKYHISHLPLFFLKPVEVFINIFALNSEEQHWIALLSRVHFKYFRGTQKLSLAFYLFEPSHSSPRDISSREPQSLLPLSPALSSPCLFEVCCHSHLLAVCHCFPSHWFSLCCLIELLEINASRAMGSKFAFNFWTRLQLACSIRQQLFLDIQCIIIF